MDVTVQAHATERRRVGWAFGKGVDDRVEATLGPAEITARVPEEEHGLIQRVCAGEKHLYYELISPYERSVYVAAYSVLQHEADAEEAAQEAFLKAFACLKTFRMESKFSTWLIQIAINEARMKRRKDRKFLYNSIDQATTDEEGDYVPRDFADWREIPSEALERSELRREMPELHSPAKRPAPR